MHHIQLAILKKLLHADGLGYAAMRPKNVESNHYAYHLEQLMKDKMVTKDGKLYRLTPQGIDYVDRLSSERMTFRAQPFIDTAIDLTTPDGKTLLFQRSFHPYFHRIGFPAGKLHMEESVANAAVRELAEKTGITDVSLTHRGVAYVDAWQGDSMISKKMYHIFHGEVSSELPTMTPEHRGSCFWANHTTLDPKSCMPGFLGIKELLSSSPTFFFAEITEQLEADPTNFIKDPI